MSRKKIIPYNLRVKMGYINSKNYLLLIYTYMYSIYKLISFIQQFFYTMSRSSEVANCLKLFYIFIYNESDQYFIIQETEYLAKL